MSALAEICIHSSQYPETLRAALLDSLRRREINHKFHYETYKQTLKWLALHEAYAPARRDVDCLAAYDAGFAAVTHRVRAMPVHVVGLGCGGGQKDAQLISRLSSSGHAAAPASGICYTPVDVSAGMVLTARTAVQQVLDERAGSVTQGVVCDLQAADGLALLLDRLCPAGAARIITCFGLLPNFEPSSLLSRVESLLRPDDLLLINANLAPGSDYAAGVRHVLPQYENRLTTDWLLTFLLDLGVEPADGHVDWRIEPSPISPRLLRIAAYFQFDRPRGLHVFGESLQFFPGDGLRLFFSYRFTPELVRDRLEVYSLRLHGSWIIPSGEEALFLCAKSGLLAGQYGSRSA